ncbi:unnamed protein product [Mytilus edulis]|uniref:Uncharacterized protein n=1 Tax=Mytilus edulis TaxID=6550 RepID=A0A8S3U370_MYTED|nr:unnamed protein product [Mytilus edulis]
MDADHCFCSTVARSENFVPTNDPDSGLICNISCSDNQSEICGGFWSLSAYKIETKEQTNNSALATIFWSANNTSLSTDNKNAATTDHTNVSGTTSVLPPVTTTSVLPPVSTTSVLPPVTTKSQLTIGSNICACSCANSYYLPMNRTLLTEIELAEKLLALTKDIVVNRIETSLYKNTKISAYDPEILQHILA